MRRLLIFLIWVASAACFGDAGVLIPRDKQQPDPAVLSLEEMEITIRIDNGDARVFVRQVFANHTGVVQEGNYFFALPSRATVSDFATWDGPTRLPAVILERKRAEELYNQLKQQYIDPGLLQQGERGAEEARRSAVFSAKITPIPARGTKRMEIEYHQSIPVEGLRSYFSIPLRPDAYQAQTALHLWIHFEMDSAHAIRGFQVGGKIFPLKLSENSEHVVKGEFEARQVALTEDFSVQWQLDNADVDALKVLTYRNPVSGQPSPHEMAPVRSTTEPGFFEAQALIGNGSKGASAGKQEAPKTAILLFDNSLSMQWEKLERSYEALEKILRGLRPGDRFNLILFNTQIQTFQPAAAAADATTVGKALDFVKASRLRGGTDLQKALETGLTQAALSGPNAYLVLLSDGGADRGIIHNGKLSAWYAQQWKKLAEAQRPRTYIFGVGDDANLPLLRMLSRNDGVLENVLSTEAADFKLNAFASKIGRSPVGQLRLEVAPQTSVQTVYALQDSAFSGSMASWVGQYKQPQRGVTFAARAVRDGEALEMKQTADLPAEAANHPQLPRLWARARVDALLEKIERDGEDRASIDEIIRLARKYKFVTPYTSFLAVPRSLLRPRVIRPGDPVLRVKTDESIVSVIALFPFGLVKKLRYLPSEDIWQTRFLAPNDMQDGTYAVRLMLRDRSGNMYREQKTFVIASTPPVVKLRLDKKKFRRGEVMLLRANASQSTRTLVARLEGAAPVALKWSQQAGTNTGELIVPENLPAGTYRLTVTAEDMAHNAGSQEVQIEVLP
ncbi:MAG: VWA domain-containing protein [Acidobacteriia bacterium]|nr:VWA domain-containing protein [Terriglobia bacterium]